MRMIEMHGIAEADRRQDRQAAVVVVLDLHVRAGVAGVVRVGHRRRPRPGAVPC